MATRVIDDTKLNSIAVAIQAKDGGGQMTVDQMPGRIAALPPVPVVEPALILWDWEGTKLAEYSAEDALALTELPAPSTLPAYADVDHDLLLFQKWNWSLANIKTWIQNHEGETRDVGAVYTTTDGIDHNYWGNPRLDTATTITMQKRGTVSIGDYAFSNYISLTKINIPDGVTSIGNFAFNNCYCLAKINIPDSVTSIGGNAFQYCNSLTQINLPNSVTNMPGGVFNSCYALKQINIPNGVTRIGDNMFYLCYSLTKVYIPNSVTSIGNNTFYGCYSLKQINIPGGVTRFGINAFQNCYALTKINIPNGVTGITDRMFQSCYSLNQINIPDGVTGIGIYAFYACYALPKINIPSSVTSIGNNAFANCSTLWDILLESKPAISSTNVFNNLPSVYRIYVPRANLSWFETATNWSTIYTQGNIVAIEDYIAYLESIGFNVDAYKGA